MQFARFVTSTFGTLGVLFILQKHWMHIPWFDFVGLYLGASSVILMFAAKD